MSDNGKSDEVEKSRQALRYGGLLTMTDDIACEDQTKILEAAKYDKYWYNRMDMEFGSAETVLQQIGVEMDVSISMKHVILLSQLDAVGAMMYEISAECVLMGILKVAKLNADIIAPASQYKREIDEDISAVMSRLNQAGLNLTRCRHHLHCIAAKWSAEGMTTLRKLFADAAENATRRGKTEICIQDMLNAIIKTPTEFMLRVALLEPLWKTKPQ